MSAYDNMPEKSEVRTFTKEELLDFAEQSLDAMGFNYHRNTEKNYIDFKISLHTCKKMGSVRVVIFPNDFNALSTYAICPMNADESERTAVMEYITRANYDLKIGHFEMDVSDGEIRYKTCLQMHSEEPTMKLVERYIAMGFLMMEKYGNGLLSVMFGFATPEEAIKAAEGI